MISLRFLLVPVLIWLCAYTTAAPPLHSPPSLSLTSPNVSNRTSSPAALHPNPLTWPTVGPPFPPFPDLPGVFFYAVPYSDPPMKLFLQHLDHGPHGSETERDELFRIAIRDAIGPEHRPGDLLDWDSDQDFFVAQQALIVVPKAATGKRGWRLTYRLWTTALTGLNHFRLAYPGVDFDYDIYIFPEEEGRSLYLGSGELFSF